VGIPDAFQRAAVAFKRAWALDSSFAPALEHGSTLALQLGDTNEARRALGRLLRIDSTSALAVSLRWELAFAVGDSVTRRAALQSDSMRGGMMLATAFSTGLPVQDAEPILRKNQARAVSAVEQSIQQIFLHVSSVASGWPSRAPPFPVQWPEPRRLGVLYTESRFADGDSAAGAAAGATLEAAIGTALQTGSDAALGRYAGGQHALDRGRLDVALRAAADLRGVRVPPDSGWLHEVPTGYALLLETQVAAKRRSPELPRLLRQLDSALVDVSFVPFSMVGNLVAARTHEEQGNLPQALAVIRRRVFDLIPSPVYVTYHREEGRLAALNGDREGAIRAYRRYLALRSGAEPRLQPQVAQVRAELEGLQRESTDK
jgi:tetratricopeptide (TPR) repeat protein